MPLKDTIQPEFININPKLRLRKYDGQFTFAHIWYQNQETVRLTDGVSRVYDYALLEKMYRYLNNKGELYFIEVLENDLFKPIGDVTLCLADLPIVIGDTSYQRRGIGKEVIKAILDRGKALGFKEMVVSNIFDFNHASIKLFTSLGFKKTTQTHNGFSYLHKFEQ